jgi:hypothetical protein
MMRLSVGKSHPQDDFGPADAASRVAPLDDRRRQEPESIAVVLIRGAW